MTLPPHTAPAERKNAACDQSPSTRRSEALSLFLPSISYPSDVFVTKAKQLKKKIQEDLTKGKQALSDVDTEFQKLLEYFPSTKKETTIEDYFAPIQVFLNNVDVVVNQIIGKEKKKEKLEKEKKSPPKKANNKKLPEFSHDDLQVQINKGVHLKKVDTVVKTGLPTKQQKN